MVNRLLSTLLAFLLIVGLGMVGGALLFSGDAPVARGFGLTLIVLTPTLLTELVKERPTLPSGKRTR